MSQFYSDPSREELSWSLPDCETFYLDGSEGEPGNCFVDGDDKPLPEGWYYWFCIPGYSPDSEPNGPFLTEDGAIEAARGE